MRAIMFVFLLFLFSPFAYSEIEPYAVSRSDGGVSIMYYDTDSPFTPEEESSMHVPDKTGLERITLSDIPQDRAERNAWEFRNGRVQINAQRKAAMDARKAKLAALKQRLGLDDEDIELIRKGG